MGGNEFKKALERALKFLPGIEVKKRELCEGKDMNGRDSDNWLWKELACIRRLQYPDYACYAGKPGKSLPAFEAPVPVLVEK